MTPLNTIQSDVERSIEDALYQVLLHNGLIPDRDLYASNSKGFADAKITILSTKGYCVDLYGSGSPADRDNKSVPRIVVTGLGFLNGDTGNDFAAYHVMDEDQKYSLVKPAAMLSNYRFQVTLTSNKTSQDRVIEAVRQSALQNLGYIKYYVDPKNIRVFDPDRFLIRYAYMKQNPDYTNGLTEKSYIYEAVDLVEQVPQVIKSDISPIKEMTLDDDNDDQIHFSQSQVIVVNEDENLEESKDTILN